jgi:hypothetical protein
MLQHTTTNPNIIYLSNEHDSVPSDEKVRVITIDLPHELIVIDDLTEFNSALE